LGTAINNIFRWVVNGWQVIWQTNFGTIYYQIKNSIIIFQSWTLLHQGFFVLPMASPILNLKNVLEAQREMISFHAKHANLTERNFAGKNL